MTVTHDDHGVKSGLYLDGYLSHPPEAAQNATCPRTQAFWRHQKIATGNHQCKPDPLRKEERGQHPARGRSARAGSTGAVAQDSLPRTSQGAPLFASPRVAEGQVDGRWRCPVAGRCPLPGREWQRPPGHFCMDATRSHLPGRHRDPETLCPANLSQSPAHQLQGAGLGEFPGRLSRAEGSTSLTAQVGGTAGKARRESRAPRRVQRPICHPVPGQVRPHVPPPPVPAGCPHSSANAPDLGL